jgi:hypothetical protein
MAITLNGTTGISGVDGSAGTPAVQGADSNTGMFFPAADTIAFAEGGTEVARFNADAQFVAAAGTASLPVITTTGDTNTGIFFPAADTIAFAEGGTEVARFDSSGNFMVGTTSTFGLVTFEKTTSSSPVIVAKNPQFSLDCWATNTTGDNTFVRFFTEASATSRGSITYNRGAGLTAYNTTSDYRSKDISGEILDASSTVLNLKPYMGTMKGATIERPMFIAHETQEIAPYAVTGEKDAVDNEGNPIYQQMDHSALVPLLTAALQEALGKITALTARITALEAAQ